MQSLVELPTNDIIGYAEHFAGPHLDMVVASIAEGNTAAQLWQIEHDAGLSFLLWDKGNNVLYLAGAPLAEAAIGGLAELFETFIRPRTLAAGRPYFKARAIAPHNERCLPDLFRGVALREAPTLFFSLPGDTTLPTNALEGIQFVPIDRSLLGGDFANREPVVEEIGSMWPSLDRFFERAFGCAALEGARLVCWCTAEYLSSERCGIGIATEPAYQRRGIASATAARFCQMARERGIDPYWECGTWNGASVRVAEKVGFARVAEERYWIGSLDA
ncbi:MAG TPA: GNAT family N-acetyltransferase [Roseiflexaceae bacterium]|nr:GNAT family N-acetyltransferase [Roseiflexaceae bacterium]